MGAGLDISLTGSRGVGCNQIEQQVNYRIRLSRERTTYIINFGQDSGTYIRRD